MGQISLPVINRTGLYSHWSGSGDNIYNYSKFIKQNIFISLFLKMFFKKKFFLLNVLSKNTLIRGLFIDFNTDFVISDLQEAYTNLTKLVSNKVALELPLYSGRLLFIKQKTSIIGLISFFQPPKGDFKLVKVGTSTIKSKKINNNFNLKSQLLLKYNSNFFSKNVF